MKKALIIGGGSKWGAVFTRYLAKSYEVDLITGSDFKCKNVRVHKVDWFGLNPENVTTICNGLDTEHYDLIFFNQNTGGGPNDISYEPGNPFPLDHWNFQFWINCQLPYTIIHHLTDKISNKTKIGWMMTGLIDGKERELWKFAGYAAVKSTNLHIMRGFADRHPGIFFALNPLWFPEDRFEEDAIAVIDAIEHLNAADNGKGINKDGTEWDYTASI